MFNDLQQILQRLAADLHDNMSREQSADSKKKFVLCKVSRIMFLMNLLSFLSYFGISSDRKGTQKEEKYK